MAVSAYQRSSFRDQTDPPLLDRQSEPKKENHIRAIITYLALGALALIVGGAIIGVALFSLAAHPFYGIAMLLVTPPLTLTVTVYCAVKAIWHAACEGRASLSRSFS